MKNNNDEVPQLIVDITIFQVLLIILRLAKAIRWNWFFCILPTFIIITYIVTWYKRKEK